MTLTPRTRLGPYEIVAPLGQGGMGEVYRARDAKLNRDVAIKVLPESFAHDAERLARFTREAQTLASLNHPNIAHIHGFEESGGITALVMELVEGEDLSQRIARGAIPLEEALPIAKQIAEALEAAHEQGIIHRDLKPANIKVRADGTVKVLDFGLAKLVQASDSGLQPARDISQSPTITSPAAITGVGVLLGTAAYMSPEQAKGRIADKRSDVWAFGCVLYEMLTGRRAFEGEDLTDTIAAVVRGQPDWTALSADVPGPIRLLIKRCLEKDRRARIGDISVAHFLMTETIALGLSPEPGARSLEPDARSRRLVWTLAGLAAVSTLAAIGLAAGWLRREPAPSAKVSFDINTETSPSALHISLSPDGVRLAATIGTPEGSALWLRRLDAPEGQTLAGTTGASYPFWSPDSRFLAFFALGKLNKMDLRGGPPQPLCDAPLARGGTWNAAGTILFAPSPDGPLFTVPSGGGEPAQATELDSARGDTAHRHPRFLPDGNHFVFFVVSNKPENTGLYVGVLDSNVTTRVVASDAMGIFAPPDHLLFMRDTTLMAQRFDPRRLVLEGSPFPVAQDVGINTSNSMSGLAVSDTGVLAYRMGSSGQERILRWVDRTGATLGEIGGVGPHTNVALAPNGERLAETRLDASGSTGDIWTLDLLSGSSSRLTLDPAIDDNAIWSPDGSQIVFASAREGNVRNLYLKSADGPGEETLLLKTDSSKYPTDWSRDGQYLLYTETKNGNDVWVLPLTGDKKPMPFLQAPFDETRARFSPDGRWIAYTSYEGGQGQGEVYVQSFPPSGGKLQISTASGFEPHWRGDGRELFYVSNGAIWAVDVSTTDSGSFRRDRPRKLFDAAIRTNIVRTVYDVTPDGQRFLLNLDSAMAGAMPSVRVVVNWTTGLESGE